MISNLFMLFILCGGDSFESKLFSCMESSDSMFDVIQITYMKTSTPLIFGSYIAGISPCWSSDFGSGSLGIRWEDSTAISVFTQEERRTFHWAKTEGITTQINVKGSCLFSNMHSIVVDRWLKLNIRMSPLGWFENICKLGGFTWEDDDGYDVWSQCS